MFEKCFVPVRNKAERQYSGIFLMTYDDEPAISLEEFKGRPSTLNWTDENYKPPTAEEIESIQKILGAKGKQMAKLVGITYNHKGCTGLRRWKLPDNDEEKRYISYAAWRVLLIAAGIVNRRDLLKEMKNPLPARAYMGKIHGQGE